MGGWRQPVKEEDLSHPGLSENRNIIKGEGGASGAVIALSALLFVVAGKAFIGCCLRPPPRM